MQIPFVMSRAATKLLQGAKWVRRKGGVQLRSDGRGLGGGRQPTACPECVAMFVPEARKNISADAHDTQLTWQPTLALIRLTPQPLCNWIDIALAGYAMQQPERQLNGRRTGHLAPLQPGTSPAMR